MNKVDLRSDTVTKPSAEMRAVMANAEVGDDVIGEDPTVNRLEEMAAEMLEKEAAIFTPSGTQCNLLALMSHCERGDEFIVGQQAHTYKYEGGGAAILGSIQPQPLEFEEDGTLNLYKVEKAIKPDDIHFAKTRLLCLENTQAGMALPLDYLQMAADFTRQKKLKLHLDGARIFNAAIKLDVSVKKISRNFDSVSMCLSKGLGAPVGSILCGERGLIDRARRWRKVLGGGMRQAGILAAAGIFALENNILRLKEDHSNAGLLAEGLAKIEDLKVEFAPSQTNMVFIEFAEKFSGVLQKFLTQKGILIRNGTNVRLVTHLDISRENVDFAIDAFKTFFSR